MTQTSSIQKNLVLWATVASFLAVPGVVIYNHPQPGFKLACYGGLQKDIEPKIGNLEK